MASSCNKCFFPFNFKHRKKVVTRDNLLQDHQKLAGNTFHDDAIDTNVEFIQLEEDYQLKIYGYCRNRFYTALNWTLIVFSFGIFGLFCYWFNRLHLYTTHQKCPLVYATKVLIEERYKDQHKSYLVKKINVLNYEAVLESSESAEIGGWDLQEVERLKDSENAKFSVHTSGGVFKKMKTVRYFNCRKSRFIWDSELCQFYKLNGLDSEVVTSYFHQQEGLSSLEQYFRRAVYGANEIIIPQRSILALLFFEILNPFFVFQFFSFVIWCLDEYVLYASAIMIMTIISIIGSGLSTYFNQRDLHKRVCSSDIVHIIQGNQQVSVPTEQLVPGDILVLPTQGCVMYCDAVLLNGSCIANESALTGESDPVMKTPIPSSRHTYENKEHARHTLYCGTEILQTRFYGNKHVLAIVIRTGFLTTKGAVMRTLLYPAPADYRFEKHSYKFVEFLAAIAGIGFLYTIISKSLRGIAPFVIAMEALDLITVVVPPALPAAMTIGAVHALLRLKKRSIFCISPRSINVSGSVNCICFDKTGTLTEEGLNMWGVIPTINNNFSSPIRDIGGCLPPNNDLLYAMVTCHTLTIIREKLCGDPMDLKIFESTGWLLEEPAINDDTKYDLIIPTIVKPATPNGPVEFSNSSLELGKEIGIVRHFTFSSSLQRMTVIARVLGASNYNIYCKGAPESICNLCLPETVPRNFHVVLKNYTRKGYRVIAAAFRPLPPSINYTKMQRLSREEVENDLIFLGLIVLENKLKPETTPVISKLKDANLRLVIVTGDNLLTAVSVARDCGIILPEQDVIAIQCVETPVPHIYYTYADVSPINSSISSPNFNPTHTSDVRGAGDTHVVELPHPMNVTSTDPTVISFDCAANVIRSAPKNYVFALTGLNWVFLKQHFPELLPYISIKANIFSRMNPDQKQNLVREMQDLGYVVAMCGDGANDCGALKAAHTGISLSNNESSAASPFTSKVQDIRCILDIIKEGRAALVTSFALFKFMALYSLTQFVSLMILYSIDNNLTDVEFLYIDLFIIACCAFSLGHTPPYQGKLAPKPPPSSLISLAAVTSLLLQTSVMIMIQMISFIAVQQYNWFTPHNSSSDDKPSSEASYENYAVFSISALQYVILTIAFHKGPPYVGYICSNYILIVCLISITSSTLYIILTPAEAIQRFFELKLPPEPDFRFVVVILGLINLVLSLLVEIVVCDYLLSTVLKQRLHANAKWRKPYANVEQELINRSDWPTVWCDGDVDFENINNTGAAANDDYDSSTAESSGMKNALLFRGGSETMPRTSKLPSIKYHSISGSVPNINTSLNNADGSVSDVKLNCVSSQTTIQSDYFTPNENFSFVCATTS